jgi:Domain of unknown function (DUF4157)
MTVHTSAPALAMAGPVLQRCGAHSCAAGGCNHRVADDELHASGTRPHRPFQAPGSVSLALRQPGHALHPEVRSAAERTFARDFSDVRIHEGGPAGRSADELGAAAYTVGNRIVFGTGRYAPGSADGRSLLHHELTHVVQQSGAPAAAAGRPITVVHDTALEAEAASAGMRT